MIHVLVVPSFYPTPASPLAGVFFREQAGALSRRGIRVGVVYPDHRLPAVTGGPGWPTGWFRIRRHDEDGVPTYRATFPAVPKAPRVRARAWLAVLRRLVGAYVADRGRPDLVHAHGILWAGVGAVEAGARHNLPVVVTAHSSAFSRSLVRSWEVEPIRRAVRAADATYAVSSALRDDVLRIVPGADVRVAPNMVDTELFTLSNRVRGAEYVWLSVGDLKAHKGHDVVLDGFAAAFGGDPSVKLRIVGDGPERPALTGQCRDLGLADRVEFVGTLSRAQVRDEMHRADAFVMGSRHETFGIAIIEALATGLPVVATQSGGPSDVVYSDVGSVVAPGDSRQLAAAMADVQRAQDTWRKRAGSIRAYVEGKYSERAVTDELIRTYEAILGEVS